MTELWTIRDIGVFGKWAPTYVAQSIVVQPDFPKPIREGEWSPDEIFAWVLTKQGVKPKPVETALYRHFDRDGALLYVGITLSPHIRTCSHRRDAEWFRGVKRIEIEWYASRREALDAETNAIRTEKPLHNIALQAA